MSKILGLFDRIVVINMATETERMKRMERRLKAFDLPFERYEAYVAKDFGPEWNDFIGHYSCAMSHKQVMENAREKNETVLILEDDCLFRDSFRWELFKLTHSLPKLTWDILHLGIAPFNWGDRLSDDIYELKAGSNAHAYVVNPLSFKLVLQWMDNILTTRKMPFDNFFDPRIKRIAVKPTLAIQEPGFSSTGGMYLGKKYRLNLHLSDPMDRYLFVNDCKELASYGE